MKNLVVSFVFLILCVTANAAQKCVDFSDLAGGMGEFVAEGDSVDWTLVYPNITIKGIAVCSNQAGEYGDVSDSLSNDFLKFDFVSGFNAINTYCWCRMISPIVSSWVMYEDYGDAEGCLYGCNKDCWMPLMYDSGYLDKFINSSNGK